MNRTNTMEDKVTVLNHIDNIDFHEQLGEGAFGTVNRITFKKPFKGYTEAAAKSVYALRKEEVDIMRKLHHPHIVALLAFYKKGPINMIILEYATNGSLHDYLSDQSKPLPDDLKLKWMKEAASAIEYLHSLNFLHRDIKANNCLLCADHVLKLCDFGLARAIQHSQSSSSIRGTYRYMSPEIHKGNERGRGVYSRPADIYAYGMLMLEIYTRELPFVGIEWQTLVFRVCNGEQPAIPKSCPKSLSDLMRQCWSMDLKRRPTIQDVIKVLSSYGSIGQPIPPNSEQGLRSSESQDKEAEPVCIDTINDDSPKNSAEEQEGLVLAQGKDIWKLWRNITLKQQHVQPLQVQNVACCPNGNMVVNRVSHEASQLYMLSGDGEYKMQLATPDADPCDRLQVFLVKGIAVSAQGHIVVIGMDMRYVHVFDSDGKYLSCFPILQPDELPSVKADPRCVAVDRDGHVLVGEHDKKIISIFTCPEGNLVKKVIWKSTGFTTYMRVNSQNQILYCREGSIDSGHFQDDYVVAMDYSGNEVFNFIPRIDEEKKDRFDIKGIECDVHDNIYILMHVYRGFQPIPSTGHLHQYSPTGAYMRCIDRGIENPWDLAFTYDGALVIANYNSVLVYRRDEGFGSRP
ncbi:uncharacterized protein [Amphiura filiformis]|uniref:uncharacterized protein n=1 Tax=Amphiura filiformis TaxID=82378 RepID=UPI003B225EE9